MLESDSLFANFEKILWIINSKYKKHIPTLTFYILDFSDNKALLLSSLAIKNEPFMYIYYITQYITKLKCIHLPL